MPNFHETYFDEKGGVVHCATPWGRWWQTVSEVHIEVMVPQGTKGKSCKVELKATYIKVTVLNDAVIDGALFSNVLIDDLIWTLEDNRMLYIILMKGDVKTKETMWEGLLKDNYLADPWLLHEISKKLDLERFQIENPGFDFRSARMAKGNDQVKQSKINEWNERQDELKEKGTFVGGVKGYVHVKNEENKDADNAGNER